MIPTPAVISKRQREISSFPIGQRPRSPPPLSFRSEARNLIIPGRAKAKTPTPAVISKRQREISLSPIGQEPRRPPPLSFRSKARNLIVPGRAKAKTPTPAVIPPPPFVISKRSEKSCFSSPGTTPLHENSGLLWHRSISLERQIRMLAARKYFPTRT